MPFRFVSNQSKTSKAEGISSLIFWLQARELRLSVCFNTFRNFQLNERQINVQRNKCKAQARQPNKQSGRNISTFRRSLPKQQKAVQAATATTIQKRLNIQPKNLARIQIHQEPITRSVQLPYSGCEAAFSQVGLFLDKPFPRISFQKPIRSECVINNKLLMRNYQ